MAAGQGLGRAGTEKGMEMEIGTGNGIGSSILLRLGRRQEDWTLEEMVKEMGRKGKE